jgi:tetratricopeptide (TPR) repeat protein
MHKAFTMQIGRDNPNLKNVINYEYNIYSQNKKFRELVEQNKGIEESLISAFGKVDISKLNADTISRREIMGKLKSYFKQDHETIGKINNIIGLSRTDYSTNQYLFNTKQVTNTINRLSKNFPDATRQIAFEAQSQYFGNACYCLEMSKKDKKFEIAALNCVNTAIDLYPYYFNTHAVKGVYFMDCEKNWDEAVIHLSKAIELKEQANTYYLRGLAYQKLGKLELAKDDLLMAKHMNPARYKEWENMNHLDIILDYFACPEKFKTLNNKEITLCLPAQNVKTQSMNQMQF